jgi:uncharacterized ferritin-like protein (DUF455 family)
VTIKIILPKPAVYPKSGALYDDAKSRGKIEEIQDNSAEVIASHTAYTEKVAESQGLPTHPSCNDRMERETDTLFPSFINANWTSS